MRLGYTVRDMYFTQKSIFISPHTHSNILTNVTRCHFSFPSSKTDDTKLKVFEEMYECVFNIQVPIELL